MFYVGHVDAFDLNQANAVLGRTSLDSDRDRLFAFGIDPPLGQLPSDTPDDWPRPEEVREYVANARIRVDELLAELPDVNLHIMLEHRLMHAETLAYMRHNLVPPDDKPLVEEIAPEQFSDQAVSVSVPAGTARLGQKEEQGFGWDNEFGYHEVPVEPFAIDIRKVSNGDYLEFVERGAPPPHYWTKREGTWCVIDVDAVKPLPLAAPVMVTYDQAVSYASWRGKRLPSEAEFHRAVWDSGGNALQDAVGSGWEWTRTPFAPFPGFQPFPTYRGYSEPFFDGEHFVLKGGSHVTDAVMLRRSFRNWFRHDYPYAYTTFRLVTD